MDVVTRADASDAAPADLVSPVNSHNEWDPLEEVIVGRLEGAVIPSDHAVVTCNIPGMAARAQSTTPSPTSPSGRGSRATSGRRSISTPMRT
jgi:hypothetical protein